MSMFAYKEDDDRYNVHPGDVWQALDLTGTPRAILACGDIQRDTFQLAHQAAGAPRISLLYSDPPWGAGNARTFRTKAGLRDGPVDFTILAQHIAALCRLAAHYIIEMGGRYYQHVQTILQDVTERPVHAYRGGWGPRAKPGAVARGEARYSSMRYLTSTELDVLDGTCDHYTPALSINALTQPGDWIADCCTGRGLTPRSAISSGRRFVGSELNPRRVAITLQKLSNEHALQPERIQ
jgi:hypothetical protein